MSTGKSLADEFGIQVQTQLDQQLPIYLVEDQQDLRLIVAHHLAKLGFATVKHFANGHDCLTFMKTNNEKQPSVIICDKDMPLMNGFELLLELKENPNCQRGAFAIALDQPDKEQIMLATENGVDGILVKPFSLKDIVPKLRHAHKVFHNPQNPELVYELAKSEFRAKNWDKAQKIFSRLAQQAEKAARPLVGLARIAAENQKWDEGLARLTDAEARNPYYVHTYVERARIFTLQGRVEDGVAQYKKAIELSPLNPLRYEEAAELMFRLHKYQEAIELLDIAVQKQLAFPSLHHYLSQGYFALKDYKKAVRHVKSALSSDPENVSYLNQLGVCYKESEQYDDATKVYNAVIKLDPDNRSALYNKALLLAAKGQIDEAIKLLRRCKEKHPDFELGTRKLKELEESMGQKAV